MARALPSDGIVVTLEREERHAAFARRYVARAGLASAVDVRQGRALDILPSLDGEEFDLVYLDADRAPIATYFDWAMRLVRLGGMIVAHNVLLGGRVAEQASRTDDEDLRAVRAFNTRVAVDRRHVDPHAGVRRLLVAVVNSR
jgi:predicted O-methyltransferase YrrM